MGRVVTLTTDFGPGSAYVGMLSGVVLSINPEAVVIDLAHDIPPQDVAVGALLLASAFSYFPADSVHVVVVDPGVGGPRRPLLMETECGAFVGPDNGVLSWAVHPEQADSGIPLPSVPARTVVHLDRPKYWWEPLSTTFHGRDIFAPVAAHYSLGVPALTLGSPVRDWVKRPWPVVRTAANRTVGQVLCVDRFGNLVTNIASQDLDASLGEVSVLVGSARINELAVNYCGEGIRALVGSSGLLEIALPGGSAAQALGLGQGAEVVVEHKCGRRT